MQVKDLLKVLAVCDPEAQVLMNTANEDGLVGNKVIEDANVFVNKDKGNIYISNREWPEA